MCVWCVTVHVCLCVVCICMCVCGGGGGGGGSGTSGAHTLTCETCYQEDLPTLTHSTWVAHRC